MSLKKAYIIVFIVLLIDQFSKIYIKTHMPLDDWFRVLDLNWFRIHFIENEGMAWGTKIPSWLGGKLTLTLFRIVAVGAIGWWLYDSVKKRYSSFLIVSIALILAGAFGNIIDSVFYGVIFDRSTETQVATLFADETYGRLFHGKVVDMFYFPLWRGTLPSWLPIWGGQEFSFFNAIFNIADAAISIGVGILIVFNKKAFAKKEPVANHETAVL